MTVRRRRNNLTGWILMIVLFGGAMALIFYILLMRAQSLSRMEQQRTQDPQSHIEQIAERPEAVVYLRSSEDGEPMPHRLAYAAAV
jgi:hypothetical protein